MSDARGISKLAGIPEIARMTGSIPSPFPLLSAEMRCEIFQIHWKRGTEFAYAITKDGGEIMGLVSLFQRPGVEIYEIGYWLGKPYWNKGYMTEACTAVLNEFSKAHPDHRVVAGAFADNPASHTVLEKLGFKPTGESENYFSICRGHKALSLLYKQTVELKDTAETHKMAVSAVM